ncbi:MAG: hypothetical protein NW201_03545 [Gemmatimonadales bacterium]|nr:hypothetical protein [Gemmatimonadales bacterium]
MNAAAALVAGLVVAACAQAPRRAVPVVTSAPPVAGAAVRQGDVVLEALNQFALPVDVVASGSGIQQRLGTVDPGMRARWRIPPGIVAGRSLQLQVNAGTAAPPWRSEALLVAPGNGVSLTIGAQLFNSVAVVGS